MRCAPPRIRRRTLRCGETAPGPRAPDWRALAEASGSLADLVLIYRRHHEPIRERGLAHYAGQPDLATAVRIAAKSRDKDDHCESHQRRLGFKRMERVAVALRPAPFRRGMSFEEVHALVSDYGSTVERFGPLGRYDVAVRIAAFLGSEPDAVYLHTGARKGARELGIGIGMEKVPVAAFPAELCVLSPGAIENFLCIFKEYLGRFT